MVRWNLVKLIGRYQTATGSRLSNRRLAQATGLSRCTIGALVSNQTTRVDLKTLDSLLLFFSEEIDEPLRLDDLLEFAPIRK
ncbi:MAG: helix-turn-helix transcriptional regulator [Chloroflexota bacterium]